ncbi:RNA polymerase sigma factor [Patescibacteria group bacterium]|nr:RNA polymerase sigma factor [Patescibacteria group bacterium]
MKTELKHNFEEIYASESDAIFRFCLSRVSNREQALDITQETFLRLWQSLSKEDKVLNSRAFLFTIAHRLIIDWYRKKKSISLEQMSFGEDESGYDPVDESSLGLMDLGAEGRYLFEKIKELPENSKTPIYMRFVEGLSPSEIGEIIGISPNAASVRLNRALEELRKISGYNKEN